MIQPSDNKHGMPPFCYFFDYKMLYMQCKHPTINNNILINYDLME